MATGTVKWFNNAKGYGFICASDTGEDIFAHFTAIEMSGYKTLKAGQMVFFEMNRGPKGLHATNIQPEQVEGEEDTDSNEEIAITAQHVAAPASRTETAVAKARELEVEMAE